ncbi:MAG: hypothetical protein JWO87_1051 [Phycisphaerales bacterium]|jgi:hypothetical protein|nr:hypothetical protein [Phycisphaerales bacterium]MDB5299388.1 hypothetical protein [Phycisphaerales bacterium]MDB5304941.1 hypothetical protein [Phycisphaerales bacterium]
MSEAAIEIPKERWLDAFNLLSKEYYGRAATIEVLGMDVGDQPVAEGQPFQGISYDPEGSMAGDVMVEVGDAGSPYETHHIHHPRAVRVSETQPGIEADILVDSEDGDATLVRLRPFPELPPPGTA